MPFPHYPQHSLPRLIGDAMPANQKGMHSGPIPTHRDRYCLRMVARHYGKPTYAFASVGRHYNLETLRERSHIISRLAKGSRLGITPFGKFAAELHKDKDMPAYTTSKSNDISKLGELAEKYGDFNYSKSIDMLICDSIVNPKQRQYYDSIVNELDYGSYESFVARIISVNNQVMNDKSLSENEKEAVLSFTSVIYSSYNLWKEYKDTSKAKWWEIAIADAIGAAVGAGVGGGVIGGVVLGAAASLEMSQH